MVDLYRTDPTIDMGDRVVRLLAEGYDGEQISEQLGVGPVDALTALTSYAERVLTGVVPPHPSPECGPRDSYNGWCYTHGVFHLGLAGVEADTSMPASTQGSLRNPSRR